MFFWTEIAFLGSRLSLFHLRVKLHRNWIKPSTALDCSLAHSFGSSGLANRSVQVGKSWQRVWTKIWAVQRYEGNLRFPCLACSPMFLFLLVSRPLPNHRPLLKILILSGLQDSFPYLPFNHRKSSTNPGFLLLPTDCLDRWGRVRTAVQTSIHAAKGCDFLLHMSHWCAVLLNWIKSFSRYSHLLGGRCERLGRLFSFPNASRNQRFLFWCGVCSQY